MAFITLRTTNKISLIDVLKNSKNKAVFDNFVFKFYDHIIYSNQSQNNSTLLSQVDLVFNMQKFATFLKPEVT